MRKFFKKIANKCINPIGLTALKTKDVISLNNKYRNLADLYNKRRSINCKKLSNSASCIVFSKDRAIQLHALLSSYFELTTNPVPIDVLYQASTPAHNDAYRELEELFPKDDLVYFHKQNDNKFKDDLVTILYRQTADKIFFLVDDMLFIEKIDLKSYTSFDTNIFIPTLRLGKNLNFCYTLQQPQPLPHWSNHPECPTEMLSWYWHNGEFDWAYPLSVDGHLFGRWEILAITKMLNFTAPNTYEMALQQFSDIFEPRLGVAYKKSAVINIPWNKVQKEHNNLSGKIHQDFLLKKWQAGKQIDYKKLYGFNNISAHQDVGLNLTNRKTSDLAR